MVGEQQRSSCRNGAAAVHITSSLCLYYTLSSARVTGKEVSFTSFLHQNGWVLYCTSKGTGLPTVHHSTGNAKFYPGCICPLKDTLVKGKTLLLSIQ